MSTWIQSEGLPIKFSDVTYTDCLLVYMPYGYIRERILSNERRPFKLWYTWIVYKYWVVQNSPTALMERAINMVDITSF